jgi:hypothetical protein
MRQVRISFPTLPGDNPSDEPLTYVQFQGTFGLQMSDPVWWWQYIRRMRAAPQSAPVFTTDNNSSSFPYGSVFRDAPQEAADGARTVFTIIPAYEAGSLIVWIDGVMKTKNTDYHETDPNVAHSFTFAVAPAFGVMIVVECRTA